MSKHAAALLLALFCAACATKRIDSSLVFESDPDVLGATRTLPPGATPPKKVFDVPAVPLNLYPRGATLLVVLDGVVSAAGAVKVVAIEKANDSAFARECVRSVRQWRFEPAKTADGNAFAMRTTFNCEYTMR